VNSRMKHIWPFKEPGGFHHGMVGGKYPLKAVSCLCVVSSERHFSMSNSQIIADDIDVVENIELLFSMRSNILFASCVSLDSTK
jgi:hypothetical protein